jgi:pyruvate, water dikinase
MLICAAWLAACSDGTAAAPAAPALRVELRSGSEPVEAYRAVVQLGADAVHTIDCPAGAPSERLRCGEGGGLELTSLGSRGGALLVKARGHSFAHADLDPDEAVQQLELLPLPAAEANAHYRTGFDAAEAEAQFLELAVPSAGELGAAQSVKFYISDLQDDPKVYFQNTRRHPLHFDFVRDVLGSAVTRAEFEQRTYHGANRRALAGTLTWLPDAHFESAALGGEMSAPIRLEFFPSDDLTPEQVLLAHRLIEERLLLAAWSGAERRLVYVPAGSTQEAALSGARDQFVAVDALYGRQTELYAGVTEQRLNPGVAYGTLRRLDPDQLLTAAVSFRDVVVLTRLPNDLPVVGGTISEELQTPLAHVNLAATARGTPNAAVLDAGRDPRIAPLLDKLVRFEVTRDALSIEATSQKEAEAFWNARAPEPLVPQSDLSFTGLPGFADLHFADAIRVGTKAANLAELHAVLPDETPDGFAVPFSAYDEYLNGNRVTSGLCDEARDDCASEQRSSTLCEAAHARCLEAVEASDSFTAYAQRLTDDAELRTDSPQREAAIDGLKYLLRHGEVDGAFAEALDARVAEMFGQRQVRLRSSTNVEDLPGFSGAGLYESFSAEGSSNDRPSLEIRKVWASVFEWRAYEERQFWNVQERGVRMGVAVHRSFDDEVANGVLITRNLKNPGMPGHYVNVQRDETPVTNPVDGALPEIFTILSGPGGQTEIVRERFSSLSPDEALLSDSEVAALASAADRARAHFAPLYKKSVGALTLDIEFKFVGEARALILKQARPYAAR